MATKKTKTGKPGPPKGQSGKKPTGKKPRRQKVPEKRPGGRPLTDIDWTVVDNLCAIQCTEAEIAAFIGVSVDVLTAAVKREWGCAFPDYFQEKAGKGRASLRRRQYLAADAGNPTMLIWLGKQWLGQTDRLDQTTQHRGAIAIHDSERTMLRKLLADPEAAKLLAKLAKKGK